MFEKYTRLYPLHKSLRFELIPNGKTKEMISETIKEDFERDDKYQEIKNLIDDYYRYYIEEVLSKISLPTEKLNDYYEKYSDEKKKNEVQKLNDGLRKIISKELKNDLANYGLNEYSKLFGKDNLPLNKWLKDKLDKGIYSIDEYNSKKEVIEIFNGFKTYFSVFKNNRDNMFVEEDKSTSIANRTITVNLTKFLNNIKNYQKINSKYPDLNNQFTEEQKKVFTVEYYNNVLSQEQILKYNAIIGRSSANIFEKGINQIINEYLQKNKLNKYAIKPMEPLFSQILSEKKPFIFESIENDEDMFEIIKNINQVINSNIFEIKEVISEFVKNENNQKLFINAKSITDISQQKFNDWSIIKKALKANSVSLQEAYSFVTIYDSLKKYEDSKKELNFEEYFNTYDIEKLSNLYKDVEKIMAIGYISHDRKVATATFEGGEGYKQIQVLKKYLDEVINIIHFYRPLYLFKNGEMLKIDDKLDDFYETFNNKYENIKDLESSYNKIRNYLTTKKTFSTEKIREFLGCSSLLTGWDDSMKRNECTICYDGEYYYLVDCIEKVTEEEKGKLDINSSESFRMVYNFQKPDNKNVPRLYIRSKGDNFSPKVEKYNLPINNIIEIYDKGYYKTEYRKQNPEVYKESLIKLIDYFKLGLTKDEDYSAFNFNWKDSDKYENIAEFYQDCSDSCYNIRKQSINFDYLLQLENEGKVLIFKIYNKDFSKFSKGNPNMHTLYFKALFDDANIKNIDEGNTYFKLDGGASLFYRKSSLERKVTHPKNQPVLNKNPLNNKKESMFNYDLIKDKRYSEDKMFLHFPISMNVRGRNYTDTDFNSKVNASLYKNDDINIIGLDRGERHLLYYTVINKKGEIIDQGSFNNISTMTNQGINIETDYHTLLDNREKQRDKARKEWGEIEQIKDLKNGYMSNVIYQLSKMMIKYNAVVVLEKLNTGFTNSRKKVEKQVYQKFEKAFIDKLNYLVFKDKKYDEVGSVYNAYQLTNPMANLDMIGSQNGFLLYINPAFTSKICPKTGFISNSIDWSYCSIEKSKELLSKLDSFSFDKDLDCFKFDIDFKKFIKEPLGKTNWTIYSYGKDRYMYSNHKHLNIDVNSNIKGLLLQNGISYEDGHDILNNVLNIVGPQGNQKYFYETILNCIKVVMQLRQSNDGSEDQNDYILSPVMDKNGQFFDSRKASETEPKNADANGAYHIALKGLYAIEHMECGKIKGPDKKEWLEYRQK